MSRSRPTAAAAASILLLASALAACSRQGDAQAPPTTAGARSDRPAEVAAPAASGRESIRDGDVVDVDALASELASGASGDQEWIDVFAELRARSWLAARYPGDYDLDEIYVEEWSSDHARRLEQESLDLGVYLDEPLPVLVSVAPTRELGELVELEVVLDAGTATVRRADDDVALGTLPGGRQRGLFTLGPDPSTDRWRIHSVIELSIVEAAEAGDTP